MKSILPYVPYLDETNRKFYRDVATLRNMVRIKKYYEEIHRRKHGFPADRKFAKKAVAIWSNRYRSDWREPNEREKVVIRIFESFDFKNAPTERLFEVMVNIEKIVGAAMVSAGFRANEVSDWLESHGYLVRNFHNLLRDLIEARAISYELLKKHRILDVTTA